MICASSSLLSSAVAAWLSSARSIARATAGLRSARTTASSTAWSSARSTPVACAIRSAPLAPAVSRRATGGLPPSGSTFPSLSRAFRRPRCDSPRIIGIEVQPQRSHAAVEITVRVENRRATRGPGDRPRRSDLCRSSATAIRYERERQRHQHRDRGDEGQPASVAERRTIARSPSRSTVTNTSTESGRRSRSITWRQHFPRRLVFFVKDPNDANPVLLHTKRLSTNRMLAY
jgi:hypothetical protein